MQFRDGAEVFTADGERVGTIDRVVLEPVTKQVTHLVVQKGLFHAEDKLVPISLVGPTTEDRVTLRRDASDLEKLPDFEESHYVPVDRSPQPQLASGSVHWARPMHMYPLVGSWLSSGGYHADVTPQYVARTGQQNPEGTVALEEGAKVISSDGKRIGDIERIFTDPLADRATHLLISGGLILKHKKLIPTRWMTNVLEKEVHLSVDAGFMESLSEYQVQV
jgi:uncharacterized protein YrrD